MKYKYLHDTKLKAVYQIPLEPQVKRNLDKSGNLISWDGSMEVKITRADNVLSDNRWKYKTSDIIEDSYPNKAFLTPKIVTSYLHQEFHRIYCVRCEEISEETYLSMKEKYEKQAKENKIGLQI